MEIRGQRRPRGTWTLSDIPQATPPSHKAWSLNACCTMEAATAWWSSFLSHALAGPGRQPPRFCHQLRFQSNCQSSLIVVAATAPIPQHCILPEVNYGCDPGLWNVEGGQLFFCFVTAPPPLNSALVLPNATHRALTKAYVPCRWRLCNNPC